MRAKLGFAAIICLALAACHGGSSSLPAQQQASQSHAATNGAGRATHSIQAYSAAVLADSPTVYYRMNETSGTTAADSSGHSYAGTYGSSVVLGNASMVSGDVAPTFPGGIASAAKVLRSSSNSALAPTGSETVEFWVNVPSSVTTNSQILWTQSFATGNYQPGYISLESGTPPYFTMQINTSNGLLAIYPAAVLGVKNHVVMTWNGTTLTGYVNGVVADSTTGSGSLVHYASPYTGFTFGGPSDAHTGFAGAVGEFAFYGAAVPAARVQAHYNAAINPDPTPPPSSYAATVLADSPVVYYRTNEASGGTAADSSGHAYNGTYGSGVTLGGPALIPGDSAPNFPGGIASAAKVLRSSSNTALAPAGAESVEFWVNVPSSVTTSSQILWTQSFASGNAYQPGYISLESGTPPYFTMQINTSNGLLSIYPAAVLGAKNHVVMTWNGTTLTGYVNGVVADSTTGSGSVVNYASPYTGFTFGGPSDAHTGFAGTAGETAFYNTALSAARVQAHYNAGASGSSGTVVWQTGGGPTLGQYTLPSGDGQCAGVGPTINGSNASFTVLRNTNATYTFRDNTPKPGASTCYRNQMNPIDPNTGTNYELAIGGRYTFTFQTVVTLNGNTAYRDDLPNNHLGADIPAIVWQTHTMNGDPCDTLVIGNTYAAYVQGLTLYGTQSPGGQATWNFHSCDDQLPGGPDHSYNSPDTLHDGQVDNWQFDITAQIQGTSGGSIVVQRNGTVVYNAPTSVCDKTGLSPQCWWNFGAYFYYFESSEEPPGWNNAGVTVQVNGMKLVQH